MVFRDNFLGHRQPQAGTFRPFGSEEYIKDMFKVVLADTGSVIGHPDFQ